jgi:plasmid stabilization system protein ParE
MNVALSAAACKDLRQAHNHIARDNPIAAAREVTGILASLQDLADTKVDGREVILDDGRRVRVWFVSSYRVYYRRTATKLQVVRIYHQARSPIER